MKKLMFILLLIPICVKASSYIVIDTDSKRVIDGSNINEIRSVASISKIMTAILAIESEKLDDNVIIGPEILDAYGSGIYIKVGEKLTLKDLVYGLLLRSGNDAALAISHYVGGNVDSFVDLMNKKASEIGMKDTIFHNPSGLDNPKGNMSTSYDMGLLISYCMQNETFKEITKTKTYKLKTNMNYYSWTNKNKLLHTYKYATGGKTGFTSIARRTLITTSTKDNVNLAVVTLNYSDDFNFHKQQFEKYFKIYDNYTILKKGTINIVDENYYDNVSYYIKNTFNYSLTKEDKDNIILKFNIIKKSIKNNTKIGTVSVLLYGKEIYKDSIYAKVKKQNLINKILGWFK